MSNWIVDDDYSEEEGVTEFLVSLLSDDGDGKLFTNRETAEQAAHDLSGAENDEPVCIYWNGAPHTIIAGYWVFDIREEE